MANRLALVACKSSAEGPWIRMTGREIEVSITHLGEGDVITFEFARGAELFNEQIRDAGSFPFPRLDAAKYRVLKHCAGNAAPTSVEVTLRDGPTE